MKNKVDAIARQRAQEILAQIHKNGRELVEPHLVAIYRPSDSTTAAPEQCATGFLIAHKGRSVLLTAKHSLYGENFDEDPMEKSIFTNGHLTQIRDLKSHELVEDPENDLLALYVNEFGLDRCLPQSSLCPAEATPQMVTIYGYLARDFKRHEEGLNPQPFAFTDSRRDHRPGYVTLRYTKSQNRDDLSKKRVMSPRPKGLSGCPMLDGNKLAEAKVCVIGAFTVQENGIGLGENSPKLLALLTQM